MHTSGHVSSGPSSPREFVGHLSKHRIWCTNFSVQLMAVMLHILGTQHADWKREHGNIYLYKTSSIYKHYIEDHQLSQVLDDHIENFSILHKNNDVTEIKIIKSHLNYAM